MPVRVTGRLLPRRRCDHWGLEQSRVEPSTAAYATAANSTFTLAYDADQNPVTETEPGGVTVASTYNNVGELTGQSGTGADAATPARTFGYNTAGTDDIQEAIGKVPASAWTPACDGDGEVRDGAWIAEVTGLLDPGGWPAGMRVIVPGRPSQSGQASTPERIRPRMFSA